MNPRTALARYIEHHPFLDSTSEAPLLIPAALPLKELPELVWHVQRAAGDPQWDAESVSLPVVGIVSELVAAQREAIRRGSNPGPNESQRAQRAADQRARVVLDLHGRTPVPNDLQLAALARAIIIAIDLGACLDAESNLAALTALHGVTLQPRLANAVTTPLLAILAGVTEVANVAAARGREGEVARQASLALVTIHLANLLDDTASQATGGWRPTYHPTAIARALELRVARFPRIGRP